MQPSDSLPPSATTPVPLAVAYLDADACSVPHEADDTCARLRAVRRRRVTGSPQDRDVSRKGEGLPGSGAVLFIRARVEHPAGWPTPRPQHGEVLVAFRSIRTLGLRAG